MRVKIRWPTEDFRSDLIFLGRNSWMIDCVVGEITKQLAERLGSVEEMTVYQLLDLEKARFHTRYMIRNTQGNRSVTNLFDSLQPSSLRNPVTVTNPLRLSKFSKTAHATARWISTRNEDTNFLNEIWIRNFLSRRQRIVVRKFVGLRSWVFLAKNITL